MKEEIKEKILNYLNKNVALKVLDNKYRKYYTGVTLNYICYDLLKAKYKKSDVCEVLLELHRETKIKSLFCPHIKNYVFENKKSGHYGFDSNSGYCLYSKKNLHEYLKSLIK